MNNIDNANNQKFISSSAELDIRSIVNFFVRNRLIVGSFSILFMVLFSLYSLTLKKTGVIISVIGLVISTFWLSIFSKGNILIFVEVAATTFGPIFGVVVADYYLFKKQQINHK